MSTLFLLLLLLDNHTNTYHTSDISPTFTQHLDQAYWENHKIIGLDEVCFDSGKFIEDAGSDIVDCAADRARMTYCILNEKALDQQSISQCIDKLTKRPLE